MKHVLSVFALIGCASLTGCSSTSMFKGKFDNILSCSLVGDKCLTNSMYFGDLFGVSSVIRSEDAAEIQRLRAAAAAKAAEKAAEKKQ